jgi:hypothetical protein
MKPVIDKVELREWMGKKYVQFAAVSIGAKRLDWSTNLNGVHLVTYDDKELYRGFSFDMANQAWSDV